MSHVVISIVIIMSTSKHKTNRLVPPTFNQIYVFRVSYQKGDKHDPINVITVSVRQFVGTKCYLSKTKINLPTLWALKQIYIMFSNYSQSAK